jgi:hypothetical protein
MRFLFLASLVTLVASGCINSGRNCGDDHSVCLRSHAKLRLVGGTATFSLGGSGTVTLPVVATNASPTPMNCTLSGLDVFQVELTDVPAGGPTLQCTAGGATLSVMFGAGVDLRSFSVGTHEISRDVSFTRCDDKGCTSCSTVPDLSHDAVNLVVDEAVGGEAPAPKLVTADYSRKARLTVDAPSMKIFGSARECTTFSLQTTLQIAQTASDWTDDPEPCICEG